MASFELPIPVSNVNELIGQGFTHVEVWLSVDQGNLYREATSALGEAPSISSLSALNTFSLAGKTLKFRLDNGPERVVVFSTLISHWTPSQVAGAINQAEPGVASVLGQSVILTGPSSGRQHTLEITGCTASDLFAPELAYGTDPRIELQSGVRLYSYIDPQGRASYRYKWRFSANGFDPISEFSARVLAQVDRLSSLPISLAIAQFVDIEGRPLKGSIIVAAVDAGVGTVMLGQDAKVYEADENGVIQVTLVQGMKVRVALEGTSIVKEFVVPAVESFDLLQVLNDAPDQFTVQSVPALLTRRSVY